MKYQTVYTFPLALLLINGCSMNTSGPHSYSYNKFYKDPYSKQNSYSGKTIILKSSQVTNAPNYQEEIIKPKRKASKRVISYEYTETQKKEMSKQKEPYYVVQKQYSEKPTVKLITNTKSNVNPDLKKRPNFKKKVKTNKSYTQPHNFNIFKKL